MKKLTAFIFLALISGTSLAEQKSIPSAIEVNPVQVSNETASLLSRMQGSSFNTVWIWNSDYQKNTLRFKLTGSQLLADPLLPKSSSFDNQLLLLLTVPADHLAAINFGNLPRAEWYSGNANNEGQCIYLQYVSGKNAAELGGEDRWTHRAIYIQTTEREPKKFSIEAFIIKAKNQAGESILAQPSETSLNQICIGKKSLSELPAELEATQFVLTLLKSKQD